MATSDYGPVSGEGRGLDAHCLAQQQGAQPHVLGGPGRRGKGRELPRIDVDDIDVDLFHEETIETMTQSTQHNGNVVDFCCNATTAAMARACANCTTQFQTICWRRLLCVE